VEQGRECRAEAEDNAIVGDRISCQWSVAAAVLYTDGDNAGKQKKGKEKDKGHGGDETSEPEDMFDVSSGTLG